MTVGMRRKTAVVASARVAVDSDGVRCTGSLRCDHVGNSRCSLMRLARWIRVVFSHALALENPSRTNRYPPCNLGWLNQATSRRSPSKEIVSLTAGPRVDRSLRNDRVRCRHLRSSCWSPRVASPHRGFVRDVCLALDWTGAGNLEPPDRLGLRTQQCSIDPGSH
jgi:hypothetical protein